MSGVRRIPYADVAEFVSSWPRLKGYGPALAERYEIPLDTARRWIKEARRRGYLPAGDPHPCPVCKGTGVRYWKH